MNPSLTYDFDMLTPTRDFAHPRKHELPDTYPKGRRCLHEQDAAQCITRLCQFNPGPYCYAHKGKHQAELVAARLAGLDLRCGTCGLEPDIDCQRVDCVLRP